MVTATLCATCASPLVEAAEFCSRCGRAVSAPRPPGRTPWGFGEILKAIGLIVVAIVVVSAAGFVMSALVAGDWHQDGINRDADALAVTIGSNIVWQILAFVIVLRFTIWKFKIPWSELGFRRPKRGRFWVPPLLVVAGWMTIGVYAVILHAVGGPNLNDQAQLPDQAFESIKVIPLVGLTTIIFAPLVEETFFRGFLFQAFRGRWGLVLAALLSGAFFGVVHVIPALYLPFGLIGIYFALSYVYTDSLWVPISAHFLFNGLSFVINVAVNSS